MLDKRIELAQGAIMHMIANEQEVTN